MKLKEKTQRKFISYFEKVSAMHNGQDFELAYSDIQQETGAASITIKRAIQILADEGIIDVQSGRNSRCARFRYLLPIQKNEENKVDSGQGRGIQKENAGDFEDLQAGGTVRDLQENVAEMTQVVEHLRRRMRNQEMTVTLLLERVAELEDKVHNR